MKLTRLDISLNRTWDSNPGKYTGTFEYEGTNGSVKLVLDPALSDALMLCIGQTVTEFARKSAESLAADIEQSRLEASCGKEIEIKTT